MSYTMSSPKSIWYDGRMTRQAVSALVFAVIASCNIAAGPVQASRKPSQVAREIRREYCASVDVEPLGDTGRGSGTIVRRKGQTFILTAAHLFTDDRDKVVRVPAAITGDCVPDMVAALAGIDTQKDLAALVILDEVDLDVGVKLSDEALLGESVVVIGSPGIGPITWDHNVTKGIVSSVQKAFGLELLKIDAAVWFGNSGGGVFNEDHRLIGVVSRLSIVPGLGVVPGGFYAVSPGEISRFLADLDKFDLLGHD